LPLFCIVTLSAFVPTTKQLVVLHEHVSLPPRRPAPAAARCANQAAHRPRNRRGQHAAPVACVGCMRTQRVAFRWAGGHVFCGANAEHHIPWPARLPGCRARRPCGGRRLWAVT
jgi:hypothetical protein